MFVPKLLLAITLATAEKVQSFHIGERIEPHALAVCDWLCDTANAVRATVSGIDRRHLLIKFL